MYPTFSSASALSRFFFWWITTLIGTGYKRDLEEDDVFDINESSKPPDLVERFWQARQTRSTWKALWHVFKGDMALSGLLFIISVALRFVGPLILNIIVTYISQSQSGAPTAISNSTAFGMAALLCASQIIGSLLSVHADFIAMRVGLNARDALIGSTFRHLAMLSNSARAKTNNGLIMSLVSNDAQVAVEFARFWNQTWTSPFVLVAGIIYIHILVGVSVWAGMSILVVFVPFSMCLARAQTKYQKQKMLVTDQRVKLSSEALQGIRIVKFNAWESVLEKVLGDVRLDELKKLRYLEYVKALTTPISVAVPNLASVLTFITYIATGNPLNPANTFSVISLFVIIRSPFVTLPIAITQFSRAFVMSNRFDAFFKLERSEERVVEVLKETSKDVDDNKILPSSGSSLSMRFDSSAIAVDCAEGSEFTWSEDSLFRLKVGRQIQIHRGEFVAIVGSVGQGKTSALLSFLGETHCLKGSVKLNGRTAYCSQEPFILNATLRDNVLFGLDMNMERYIRAIRLACLDSDVEKLPGADMTEIGERGVNLSGGQKARVAFARALYSNADILFMDDVMSAVDAHVGKVILEGCLLRLKAKTRILVTNNLHVLGRVDKVIVVVNGEIKQVGPMRALLKEENSALAEIMHNMAKEDEEQPSFDPATLESSIAERKELISNSSFAIPAGASKLLMSDEKKDNAEKDTASHQPPPVHFPELRSRLTPQHSEPAMFGNYGNPATGDQASKLTGLAEDEAEESEDPFADDSYQEMEFRFQQKLLEPQRSMHAGAKLTAQEHRVKGKVSSQVLKTYWLSGAHNSYFLVFLLLFCFFAAEAVFMSVDAFLAQAAQSDVDTSTFLIIYSCLSVGAILGIMIRSFGFAVFHLAAVKVIYSKAAERILRFPMTFYWKEPLGRLLNRLSADTNVMDTMLGSSWLWLLLTIVRVIGILCLIILAVPIFAAALVPLFLIYFYVREVYRRSATNLQRIEAVTKSPIMNALTETLQGTSTIRAYGRVAGWIRLSDEKIVTNTRAKFSVESLAVWLTLYLEFLGAIIILITGMIIVSAKDSIGSGYAGLALAYSFNIVINLNFSVKQAVMTEQQMSAVERLKEYMEVPVEPFLDDISPPPEEQKALKSKKAKKPATAAATVAMASSSALTSSSTGTIDLKIWPERGEVRFDNVFLKYRDDLPWALKELSFTISAGERCGIVGKTGGGKSSLFVCLLRLVDCSSGAVYFDGQDITRVSKRTLRSKVTIVPQDPVVFKGSLRYNLDPFNQRSDAEIWEALRASKIDHLAESSPEKLDLAVAENGSNFSVGERALICMARAILRKSKIVCLDEASSALDSNTDVLIQETIREHFRNSTLLVIAHRLDTVIDLDSVLVMGDGKMLEKDTAHVLLQREDSAFSVLVKETGPTNAKMLRDRAAQVAEERKSPSSAIV